MKWTFDFCKKLVASIVLVVVMLISAVCFAVQYFVGWINLLAYMIDSDVTKWYTNWLFRFGRSLYGDDWGSTEDEIV